MRFAALIFALMLAGILAIIWLEHRPQGVAMVLLTSAPDAAANRLFLPCPLSPKNIPPRQETDA